MGGGLINIVSYVSSDLYLTGDPHITFFKFVYRRYTNFAVESVYLNFLDDVRFNHESELIPPRIGDLIHKGYLHIKLPSISISKQDVGIDTSMLKFDYADNDIVSSYQKISNIYMEIMTGIYSIAYSATNAVNVSFAGLIQDVADYVALENRLQLLSDYDSLLLETRQELAIKNDPREAIMDSKQSNLWYIISHINVQTLYTNSIARIDTDIYPANTTEYVQELQRIMKTTAMKEINRGLSFCQDVQKYFFDENNLFVKKTNQDRSKNIKCAWVNNIGHSIIEYIDVYINGIRIDRHIGMWIEIWRQLTYTRSKLDSYNEMIGNVSQLTNFDDQEKPQYDVYVPLSFWFNKYNGTSFPLIAMQYSDIRFNVKLRKFSDVFHIERIYRAKVNGSDIILTANLIDFILNRSLYKNTLSLTDIQEINDIVLDDIWEDKGKNLNGDIMLDYVYLSSDERKRFAQSGHEYLIERMQIQSLDNINQVDPDIRLDFVNPSKEIVWAFHKNIYKNNDTAWKKCKWADYSSYANNVNPMTNCKFKLNNYDRIDTRTLDGSYFGVYQPITYHNRTVTAGVNMYSFSLNPTQYQPTGTCNFSRLSDIRLSFNLNDTLFRYTDRQIYPYDDDIDYSVVIQDLNELMTSLDVQFATSYVINYEKANSDIIHNSENKLIYTDSLKTIEIYDKLFNDEINEIKMSEYRQLIFGTTASLHVFSVSLNILRLIGGYGALAFSGNT
jgi:hypothetical protein